MATQAREFVHDAVGTSVFKDGRWRGCINGAWEPLGGDEFCIVDPSTASIIDHVPAASPDQVDRAVEAARKAFATGRWPRASSGRRAGIMLKLADALDDAAEEFATLESVNNGMALREARAMVKRCVTILQYAAGLPQRAYGTSIPVSDRYVDFTVREPIGVCALIIPWNGPLISAIAKIAPAVALGNTVVFKPSELTPFTALKFAALCEEVGIEAGVVNVITGGPEVGRALVAHPDVDKIAFTGSTATGKHIMRVAADRMKRLTLELGGKAPHIFFEDVPTDQAVAGALSGLLRNTGQTCIAGARILVHRSKYDEFVERSTAAIARIKVGPGSDPSTQLGPIVSEKQLDRVQGFVKAARDDGAEVHGADRLGIEGYFMAPGLVTGASISSTIGQEEVFGPVGMILPFEDESEAVALANDTRYGLAAGVWTHDVKRSLRVTKALRAGTVWVNTYGWNFTEAPMGGYKESGFGRENGNAFIDAYTEIKNVVLETQDERTLDIYRILD